MPYLVIFVVAGVEKPLTNNEEFQGISTRIYCLKLMTILILFWNVYQEKGPVNFFNDQFRLTNGTGQYTDLYQPTIITTHPRLPAATITDSKLCAAVCLELDADSKGAGVFSGVSSAGGTSAYVHGCNYYRWTAGSEDNATGFCTVSLVVPDYYNFTYISAGSADLANVWTSAKQISDCDIQTADENITFSTEGAQTVISFKVKGGDGRPQSRANLANYSQCAGFDFRDLAERCPGGCGSDPTLRDRLQGWEGDFTDCDDDQYCEMKVAQGVASALDIDGSTMSIAEEDSTLDAFLRTLYGTPVEGFRDVYTRHWPQCWETDFGIKFLKQAVADNIIGFLSSTVVLALTTWISRGIFGSCLLGINFKKKENEDPSKTFTQDTRTADGKIRRGGGVRSSVTAYVASPCLTELDIYDSQLAFYKHKYRRSLNFHYSDLAKDQPDEWYEETFRFTEACETCGECVCNIAEHKKTPGGLTRTSSQDGLLAGKNWQYPGMSKAQAVKKITSKAEYMALDPEEQLTRKQKAGLYGWKGVFEASHKLQRQAEARKEAETRKATAEEPAEGSSLAGPRFSRIPNDEYLATNGACGDGHLTEIEVDDKGFDLVDIINFDVHVHQDEIHREQHEEPDDPTIEPRMVEGLYICTFDLDNFTRADTHHLLLGLRVHGEARVKESFLEGDDSKSGHFLLKEEAGNPYSPASPYWDIDSSHLRNWQRKPDVLEDELGYCKAPKFEEKPNPKDSLVFRFHMEAEDLFHPPLFPTEAGKEKSDRDLSKWTKAKVSIKNKPLRPPDPKTYYVQRIIKSMEGTSEVAAHHKQPGGVELEGNGRLNNQKTDASKVVGKSKPKADTRLAPMHGSKDSDDFHYMVFQDNPMDNRQNVRVGNLPALAILLRPRSAVARLCC